jgi:hypothetical protein
VLKKCWWVSENRGVDLQVMILAVEWMKSAERPVIQDQLNILKQRRRTLAERIKTRENIAVVGADNRALFQNEMERICRSCKLLLKI